jgi:hypothetical protein
VVLTQGSGGNVTVADGDTKIVYSDGAGAGAAVVDLTADLAMSSVNITGGSITGITDLAVADGGTGASSASAARTNLGLGTGDSPTFTAVTAGQVDITAQGDLRLQDTTGGQYVALQAPGTVSASYTLTLPAADGTSGQVVTTDGSGNLTFVTGVTLGTAQTFTAAQTFRASNAIRSEAASTQDAVVIAGRAGGTSSHAVTLTPATLSGSRTLTLPEPGENVTLGYLNIPQNSQSGAYTLVATDTGKHILHPSADTTARTFTIPANGSVPFAVGTAVTFINQNGAGVVTIAITTDTMRLAGAGTTGSRTLAADGIATAIKVTSTEWIISGTGLT